MKTIKTRSPMGGTGKETTEPATDVRKVAAFRERQRAAVERIKQSLAAWIDSENGNAASFGANYTEVSVAMLETAFDRHIDLLGAMDAFELIESAFRRRAEMFRRSLQ